MSPKPAGYDRSFTVQTPDGHCEIGVGIEVVRGDVARFLVQLQFAVTSYGSGAQEVARIDHDPASPMGHDVRSEGIHVDVVLPDGTETTLFPRGGEAVSSDLGVVIDLATRYFRSHHGYFVGVHRGETSPQNHPGGRKHSRSRTFKQIGAEFGRMSEEAEEPVELTPEEFTAELARLLDRDPDELRAKSRAVELEPPWEAAQRQLDE